MTIKLTRMQTDLNEAHAAKSKPFEHADELAAKSARLEQLKRELEVGKTEEVIMNNDEKQYGSRLQDSPIKTEEIRKHKMPIRINEIAPLINFDRVIDFFL